MFPSSWSQQPLFSAQSPQVFSNVSAPTHAAPVGYTTLQPTNQGTTYLHMTHPPPPSLLQPQHTSMTSVEPSTYFFTGASMPSDRDHQQHHYMPMPTPSPAQPGEVFFLAQNGSSTGSQDSHPFPIPQQSSGVSMATLLGGQPTMVPQQTHTGSFVVVQHMPPSGLQPLFSYNNASLSIASSHPHDISHANSLTQLHHYAQNNNSGSGYLLTSADNNTSAASGMGPYTHLTTAAPQPHHVYLSPSNMSSQPIPSMNMHPQSHLAMIPPSSSVFAQAPRAPPPYTPMSIPHHTKAVDVSTVDKPKSKKKKVLTPRTKLAKELEIKEREAAERANRGGKTFEQEPFELDSTKKQLIVNFISHTVTSTEFSTLFEDCGPITVARIIYDKHSHRSKGYGFVYFKNGDDAITAIKKFNGLEVHGKLLKVSYATPQRPTPPDSPREEGLENLADINFALEDDESVEEDQEDPVTA